MSMETMNLRMKALEARQLDMETSFNRTIYRMERDVIELKLDMTTVLNHFGLPKATQGQVDEVLDGR